MSGVFCRQKPKPIVGLPLQTILKRYIRPVSGVVGIEVEVEGNKFPKVPGYENSSKARPLEGWKFWSYVKDGSLRGKDNAEYVLQRPLEFVQVPEAIEELRNQLASYGSVLSESNRTSVHVHLNCQPFYMNRLASFCALFFCMEEVLTEWCGDHRVGNLFCLRGKDAPAIVTKIKKFIQSDGKAELTDSLHYSALNANALFKFGSLEVRTMRGVTDFNLILQWVKILERLYLFSDTSKDPSDIPGLFSQHGPLSFFETVMGECAPIIRAGIDFTDNQLRESMYEGIRLAQDLCYCRDWSLFTPANLKPDPFGREPTELSSAFLDAIVGAIQNQAPQNLQHIVSIPSPMPAFLDFEESTASPSAPLPTILESGPEEIPDDPGALMMDEYEDESPGAPYYVPSNDEEQGGNI